MLFSEIAGWIGMILVLTAYILVSFKKVDSQGTLYQLLNLSGVVGLGINVFVKNAWPLFTLECFWGGVALAILIKKFFPNESRV